MTAQENGEGRSSIKVDKIKKLFYFLPNTGITINEASLNTGSTVISNLAGCVFFRVQCGKQQRGDHKIIQ